MASSHRRNSSIDRASIESILSASNQPAAPPSPRLSQSPNRPSFTMDPPPRPATHSRAASFHSKPNRLSISFPVAPSISSNEPTNQTPTSLTTFSYPPTPATSSPAPSPSDANGFLVALASQERRVLELKEELQKAEDELKKLKRQWAHHEAHKKKAEIRHMEPLQPLHMLAAAGSPQVDPPKKTRSSAELERRRTVLNNLNIPKETRRKFSGAHTRTLSLLSPERSNFREPSPLGPSSDRSDSGVSRSTTMPDTSQGISRVTSNRTRHSYHQGGISHGAKQIAEDLKSGLWTFMEDLRQATVGDEAINGAHRPSTEIMHKTPNRKAGKIPEKDGEDQPLKTENVQAKDTLSSSNSLLGAAEGLWSEPQSLKHSASRVAPASKAFRPLSLAAAPVTDDLDDDWSNWDSPTPKSPARWSGSTNMSGPTTPSSNGGNERDVKIIGQSSEEGEDISKRDEIPWPVLEKLSPQNLKGNLQRTMSTIMKEWEKNITPPLEDRAAPSTKVKTQDDKASSARRKGTTQDDVLLMS